MTQVLQENYGFQLLVGAVGSQVDYMATSAYLLRKSVQIVQSENNEVGTFTARLEDTDGTLDFSTSLWLELRFKTTSGVTLFGGYLVTAIPEHSKDEFRAIWTLKGESWMTLLNKVPAVKKTWVAMTAKAILQDLFTSSGLTGFDTTTYVSTGDTIASFVSTGEAMPNIITRLAGIANLSGGVPFAWSITPGQAVRFGLASSFAAPFAIVPLASADWETTFPALSGTSKNFENPDTVGGTDSTSGKGRGTPTKWY